MLLAVECLHQAGRVTQGEDACRRAADPSGSDGDGPQPTRFLERSDQPLFIDGGPPSDELSAGAVVEQDRCWRAHPDSSTRDAGTGLGWHFDVMDDPSDEVSERVQLAEASWIVPVGTANMEAVLKGMLGALAFADKAVER